MSARRLVEPMGPIAFEIDGLAQPLQKFGNAFRECPRGNIWHTLRHFLPQSSEVKPMLSYFNSARLRQLLHRVTGPLFYRLKYGYWNRRQNADEKQIFAQLQAATPIFVFQMGKVASTSIYRMLSESEYPGVILHSHTFDCFHRSPDVRAFCRFYRRNQPSVKIISLVREPVSRNISAFFQNMRRDTGLLADSSQLDIESLKQDFLRNYPHEIPLIWFDNNIHKHFGIDVYEIPFPASGHVVIERENVRLLILRHDLADVLKTELVSKFVGIDNLRLTESNVGAEKPYAAQYAEFRKIKLPLQYLHSLAASRYMKHFFRPEMRQILETWSEEPLGKRKSA